MAFIVCENDKTGIELHAFPVDQYEKHVKEFTDTKRHMKDPRFSYKLNADGYTIVKSYI